MSELKFLQIGDKAPDFTLNDQNGTEHTLQTYKGKKLVIYFYPKDLTPGCIQQACNIRDNYTLLQQKDIQILGVSADSEKSHKRFEEKKSLPFSLLADTNRDMCRAYGVFGPKSFMGKKFDGIHRTTFLINEEGIIVSIIEKPKTKAHAEEILELFENYLVERK